MSKLSEFYGDFNILFQGVGKLNDHECQFEAGQQSDGGIMLRCETDTVSPCIDRSVTLIGTAEGKRFQAKGEVIRNTVTGRYSHFFSSSGRFDMSIGELDWSQADSVRFAIKNFQFTGNEFAAESTGPQPTLLRLSLDGVQIVFEKVDDYEPIMDSLQRKRGTEVTCEFVIEIKNRCKEEIIQFVDAICALLTIARGTKINWTSYKLCDSGGIELGHHFEPRITVPFTSIPLVKSINYPADTVRFLEQCYPVFVDKNSRYHFDHVGNFLANIHSKAFLETRCLLLFSVAEVLASADKKSGKLLKRLRDFADKHNVPVYKCQVKRCGRACGTCEPKCKECKYRCEDECEIGLFVKDRNGIVHEMGFPDHNTSAGYFRNLHFLHRMILSALDFRGALYDWKEGGPVWQ